jgi:hypothetical protein
VTITALLTRWADAITNDAENRHIGRSTQFVVLAENTTGAAITIRYDRGIVDWHTGDTADRQSPDTPVGTGFAANEVDRIHLRATDAVWRELANPSAAPRRHDLLSLIKADDGIEVLSGWIALVRHLRVISRLVEIGKAHDIA